MNNETLTKCICHKGFSGYSSIVARSNFRVGGQETTPQSLTAHTLDRYAVIVPKPTTDRKLTKLNDRQEKHFNNYWKYQQKFFKSKTC